MSRLQNIFSRIDSKEILKFDSVNQTYNNLTIPVGKILNSDITVAGKDTPPVIHPVGDCEIVDGSSERCEEIYELNMTVNGQYQDNVKITTLPNAATIKFFAYADKNQMPIKQVSVDWGNGKGANLYGGRLGSLANQRGVLEANECTNGKCIYKPSTVVNCVNSTDCILSDIKCTKVSDCKNQFIDVCKPVDQATSFGTILNKSCNASPFVFNNTYDCIDSVGKDVCGVDGITTNCWDNTCAGDTEMQKKYGGCCVFIPKVQVLDNWGWCNGTCSRGVGAGCYDDSINKKYECDNLSAVSAFTSFKYKVLVAPNKTFNPVQ